MNARSRLLLTLVCALSTACDDSTDEASTYEVVREMRGDTTVVRTVSGSVWGAEAHLSPEVSIGKLDGDLEYLFGQVASLAVASDGTIYVVDRQVAELRAYGADGVFKAVIGHPG